MIPNGSHCGKEVGHYKSVDVIMGKYGSVVFCGAQWGSMGFFEAQWGTVGVTRAHWGGGAQGRLVGLIGANWGRQ